MNNEQKHTPEPKKGPWLVEKCSGGNGYRAGFYVYRNRPDWHEAGTEWFHDEKRRIACFRSEEQARAVLANLK